MTMRDPEVVDLLRDEPELLALADAVADTQGQPQRVSGLAPKLAAVAVVAAGIAAVVLLWPGGGSGNGVLGRALAAIGDGQVLHLVMQGKTGEVLVNLDSGERRVQTERLELWTDRSFERAHFVMRIDGQVFDVLLPDDAKGGGFSTTGAADPSFTAFWTGYGKALQDGDATVERTGTVAGRPVYWLRFASTRKGVPGTEVAVDEESYKPLVLRSYVTPTTHDHVRILVAETIPYDAADFKRTGSSLFAGITGSSSGSSSASPATQHPVVKAPWLTPGDRVAGLSLSSVGSYSTSMGDRTINGIELQYGDGGYGPNSMTIDELPRADDPFAWNHIPPGWISIQKSEGQSGTGSRTFATWEARLVRDGIYVTIGTGAGEDAVLEAARALQRAP